MARSKQPLERLNIRIPQHIWHQPSHHNAVSYLIDALKKTKCPIQYLVFNELADGDKCKPIVDNGTYSGVSDVKNLKDAILSGEILCPLRYVKIFDSQLSAYSDIQRKLGIIPKCASEFDLYVERLRNNDQSLDNIRLHGVDLSCADIEKLMKLLTKTACPIRRIDLSYIRMASVSILDITRMLTNTKIPLRTFDFYGVVIPDSIIKKLENAIENNSDLPLFIVIYIHKYSINGDGVSRSQYRMTRKIGSHSIPVVPHDGTRRCKSSKELENEETVTRDAEWVENLSHPESSSEPAAVSTMPVVPSKDTDMTPSSSSPDKKHFNALQIYLERLRKHDGTLSKIQLGYVNLDDKDIQTLAAMLLYTTSPVKYIDLSNIRSTPVWIDILAKMLISVRSELPLSTMYLYGCNIGNEEIKKLSGALHKTMCPLEKIHFHYTYYTSLPPFYNDLNGTVKHVVESWMSATKVGFVRDGKEILLDIKRDILGEKDIPPIEGEVDIVHTLSVGFKEHLASREKQDVLSDIAKIYDSIELIQKEKLKYETECMSLRDSLLRLEQANNDLKDEISMIRDEYQKLQRSRQANAPAMKLQKVRGGYINVLSTSRRA